ncbi:hypothetical protein YC2023_077300 [Brassica napus]
MAHYNTFGEVVYNESLTCWRFREAKMEMTVNELTAERFKGLEKQEGKWVEIFRVEVGRALLGFKATNSPYTLVRIIDPLNNRHYMEFKNILDIPHISNMNRNYLICMKANH